MVSTVVRAEIKECVLENDFLKRKIVSDEYGVHTTELLNKLTGKTYEITSAGFRFTADGGTIELRSSDFETLSLQDTQDSCVYELENKEYSIKVIMKFSIEPGRHWTRKEIEIVAGEDRLINEVEVERLRAGVSSVQRFDTEHDSKPPWHWAGGRPLFVDGQLFLGLEYPAGYNDEENGLFILHHYPGRKGSVKAKPAVIGVAENKVNHRVEDAFRDYLNTIRYKPARRFILWNGYFNKINMDGGPSDIYTGSMLKKKFQTAKRAFNDVGALLDCVLMDGGWADPQSLMEEDRRAPGRVKETLKMSRKYLDAPLGLHVITHGIRTTIDKHWLGENFDMIDDEAYCFADPRAADLQIRNLLAIQRRYKIAAFKFDWGRYTCTKTDHRGHLPGERYAREAITDNQIRMLTELHNADPECYLFNTGWYSPWWLMHYEAVFSGEDDFNYALVGPPGMSRNSLQATWRDAVIYRNIVEPQTQFPLDALMNHSPVSWRWFSDYQKYDQGPLDSFADLILINFLRGNGLIEFYYNIFNLNERERQVWGAIVKWARANDEILLSDSKHFGGDPFKGDIYGYAHFKNDNRGIIGIRNPEILASEYTIVLDEKIGFNDIGKPHRVRISYPYEAVLGSDFKYGDKISVSLERGRLIVMDIEQAAAKSLPEITDFDIVSHGQAEARKLALSATAENVSGAYSFNVPANLNASLVFLTNSASYLDQKDFIMTSEMNGEPYEPERIENCLGKGEPAFDFEPHDGWVIHKFKLPEGESSVTFDLKAGDAVVQAWLMTETPGSEIFSLFKTGLPAIWVNTLKSETKLF